MGIWVHKLGGSVLPDAAGVRRAVEAVVATGAEAAVVVVSACAGVTDRLLALGQRAAAGDFEGAQEQLEELFEWHRAQLWELSGGRVPEECAAAYEELCAQARRLCRGIAYLRELTARSRDALLAFGELLSSWLVYVALRSAASAPVSLLDARMYVQTDASFGRARPDLVRMRQRLSEGGIPEVLRSGAVLVTQGFIGATAEGITTTLGRGGSDLSAALFAVALGAEEVRIWKNVAGVYTADPHQFPEAERVPELSAAAMQELALAGAKVLHPDAVAPAIAQGIAVRICGVSDPQGAGTLIRLHAPAVPRPVAMAWRRPCWVYRRAAAGEGDLPPTDFLLAFFSRSGGLLVTEARWEEAAAGGWREWETPQALLSLVGAAPESWAAAVLEELRRAGVPHTVLWGDSPWAVRVLVSEELWRDAAACLHRMVLQLRCCEIGS